MRLAGKLKTLALWGDADAFPAGLVIVQLHQALRLHPAQDGHELLPLRLLRWFLAIHRKLNGAGG